MGIENTGIDRSALEKRWANEQARLTMQTEEDKALWAACRYTVRPFVYYNKILLAWRPVKGQPVIQEVLTVTDINVNFQTGTWVHMKGRVSGQEVVITQVPRRILPNLDIVAWMPYFNEMRYSSQDWENPLSTRNLRLSACFKTRDKPDLIVEGQDYLTELHMFRERFPQYSKTSF
jgi:hypothetical protein